MTVDTLTSAAHLFGEYFSGLAAWTEKHAGLGGWVGAAGAVLAIFVTWGLARAEYLRSKRQDRAKRRTEIDLIAKIIFDFEALLQTYAKAAVANSSEAIAFYTKHLNDADLHGMRDLAHMPVTSWPSLETYRCFKLYWFFSVQLLETSNTHPINVSGLPPKLEAHDYWFEHFKHSLETARKSYA